jgi:hypothetical protein
LKRRSDVHHTGRNHWCRRFGNRTRLA